MKLRIEELGSLLLEPLALKAISAKSLTRVVEETLEKSLQKGLSFDPSRINFYDPQNPQTDYVPYMMTEDGKSFVPYSIEHWTDLGKPPEFYETTRQFYNKTRIAHDEKPVNFAEHAMNESLNRLKQAGEGFSFVMRSFRAEVEEELSKALTTSSATPVGTVHRYKDGNFYRKVAPGEWKLVSSPKGKESDDATKKPHAEIELHRREEKIRAALDKRNQHSAEHKELEQKLMHQVKEHLRGIVKPGERGAPSKGVEATGVETKPVNPAAKGVDRSKVKVDGKKGEAGKGASKPKTNQSARLAMRSPRTSLIAEPAKPQQSTSQTEPTGPSSLKEALKKIDEQYKPSNPKGEDTMEKYLDKEGMWQPERIRLHNKIINDLTMGVPASKNPEFLMMGGGSASGKSSAIRKGAIKLPDTHVYIDSDEIKGKIPEYKAMTQFKDESAAPFAHEESSYLAKSAMAQSFDGSKNTVLDGTGDGSLKGLQAKVEAARRAGYKVRAEYCTVSVESALARNAKRAERTGRKPKEETVRAIHKSVSQILPQAIKSGFFDEMNLWDNEGAPVLVASAKGTELKIHDEARWNSFVKKGVE